MPNLVGNFMFNNGYDRARRRPEQLKLEKPAADGTSQRGAVLPLPVQLPQRFGPLCSGLGLQPPLPELANSALLTRLAVLCAYTLGILRLESDVTYHLHSGVPSPRSLFPSRLFVRVPSGHEVPAGWYRYHPVRHCLEEVGTDVEDLRTDLERRSPWAVGEITVCVATDFRVLADKYGEYALRLSSIEAGHVAENLALLGRSLGWTPSLHGFFDDRLLAQALGLDPEYEGAFAVVVLRSGGRDALVSPTDAGGASLCVNVPQSDPGEAAVTPSQQQASHQTLGRLPLMQTLSARVTRPLPGPSPQAQPFPDTARFRLPLEPIAWAEDLRQLILRRNSGGEYRGLCAQRNLVSQRALAAVLDAVAAPETESDMNGVIPAPYLMVAAIQVEGLPIGLYRYIPEERDLLQIYAKDDADRRLACQLIGNGVTPEYLAFRVFVIAPTREAFDRAAARAYRLLHMRAGAIGQRICLAAAEQGLFCRPFLSINEAECERTLGLSGTDHVILSHMLIGSNRYRGWIHDMSL